MVVGPTVRVRALLCQKEPRCGGGNGSGSDGSGGCGNGSGSGRSGWEGIRDN